MNLPNENIPFKKRIKVLKLKKTSSSSFIMGTMDSTIYKKININTDKKLNYSHSQKMNFNNSCKSNKNTLKKGFSSIVNNSSTLNHSLLYGDLMKLKKKINNLKLELSFLRSENRKKEEEIKKVEKFIENSKNKIENKKVINKLKGQNQIIKLKEIFQKLQSEIKETNDENNVLSDKIKNSDINDIKNEYENNIFLYKEKVKEYSKKLAENREREKQLNSCFFNIKLYLKNHSRLESILKNIESENNKITDLKQTLQTLKEKCNKIDAKKKQLLSYNDSIEKNNKKLMSEKKKREEFIMQKPLILQQIEELEQKTKDLEEKERDNKKTIKDMLTIKEDVPSQEIIKPKIEIQRNPNVNSNQKILLYKSLIKESKLKQKELIELFEYYNDFLQQCQNSQKLKTSSNVFEEENNIDSNNNNKNNEDVENLMSDLEEKNNNDVNIGKSDTSPFMGTSPNSTNRKKDINLDGNFSEGNSNNDELSEYKDFKLLLFIMFKVKKVQKEKIENILLNLKTQNYFLDNLKDKDNYLLKLSKELLALIQNKNENDQNTLKKILLYYFEKKYKNNKELFLNNISNDIFDNNNNQLLSTLNLDDIDKDNKLLEKIKNSYSKSINNIIEKINNNNNENREIISYKDIATIFREEELYNKNNKENAELFYYFIYILKKNISSSNKTQSINDFLVKDILQFLNGKDEEQNINYENHEKKLVIENKKDSENKSKNNYEEFENDDENFQHPQIIKSSENNRDSEIIINSRKKKEKKGEGEGRGGKFKDNKKVEDNFFTELKNSLNEKKMSLKELIGRDNIKFIENDENKVPVVNINKFYEILKEKKILSEDDEDDERINNINNIINGFKINDNSDDINLDLFESELK